MLGIKDITNIKSCHAIFECNGEKYEDDFEAGMGAEAIKKLLERIDLEELSQNLKDELYNIIDKLPEEKLKTLYIIAKNI